MATSDMTVTIRAIDEATPVIKRIQRRLWWIQYGSLVTGVAVTLLAIATFILGRLTA